MSSVVVVGAGISGLACARVLVAAGHRVRVLDRGRRVGGRMASRTVDGRPVDIGASYFTVSEPVFAEQVEDWRTRGLAAPWTDTFVSVTGSTTEPKSGPLRWGAPRGLRSLAEDLAGALQVTSGRAVEQVSGEGRLAVDGEPADAVVLAMPDPQAARLLDAGLAAERADLDRAYEPVLALTATFAERPWDLDGAFVDDDPVLDWVADDGRRRGDGAPVLVAHSASGFAARHLDDPAAAVRPMVAALQDRFGVPAPVASQVHRWRFGRPVGGRDRAFLLSPRNLGACGDAWSAKPRVEGAFLSGVALGSALAERLA